ncbi:MAG: dephospho-CoA kinase [Bacteroidetes bacterium]|nr:dephospho-CoA kinase [Bacteroidota bacterium]
MGTYYRETLRKKYKIIMIRAGVTGGIGSGKSIVCHLFSILGIPVYNADHSAKMLMESDERLKKEIKVLMGTASYFDDGSLNRSYMAAQVFKNEQLLQELNLLVHPAVMNDYMTWLKDKGKSPYTLLEAAIMIETGIHKELDAVIVVDAPELLRISRVKRRDHRSEEEIKEIISRQWRSEERIKYASFVVENDDKNPVIPQVLEIDNILRRKSNSGITS